MKIAINTSHQRFGGAIQVALSFINECRNFTQHEFFVWVGPGVRKSLVQDEFTSNFHFEHFDFGAINLQKTFEINRTMQEVENRVQPDVIIATSGPSYFHSKAPQIIGYNLPLYIYPESPFIKGLSAYSSFRRYLKKKLHFYFFKRDADIYVVQTDDVNKRVRKALGSDQVYTVTNTASNYYKDWEKCPAKLRHKDENTFRFVTISSYYGHKDLEIIPKVLEILKSRGVGNVEFVLTLKEEDYQKYIGFHGQIQNVGPIKPPECPSLYSECDGMFLPTLAECFSASYPEAMIMEKPILTTDLGFARSICGDAALFYEPKNAEHAADQIERLIEDKDLQGDLIAKGKEQLKTFDSPQERAEKYINLCEKLVIESHKE
ncbi:glycosyltransferase [Salibacter halophilus]|uniref:Glycosyltransferase n=1 Tax=Salibacter halophilus TaxID=1803916 RepID=A0A6N6M5R8_9FLAO|nr:glycosyltransferase [Salibacter halophilus]KAB1063543.1 glycosyltransferase [Salibacter halophilus]